MAANAPRPGQGSQLTKAQIAAQQRAAAQRHAAALSAAVDERIRWMLSVNTVPLSHAGADTRACKRAFLAPGFRKSRPGAPITAPGATPRPELPKLKQARSERAATKYRSRMSDALAALDRHTVAVRTAAEIETRRINRLRAEIDAYHAELIELEARTDSFNRALDDLEDAYAAGSPWAIECILRLQASRLTWPPGGPFPAIVTAFDSSTRKLVAEMNLPGHDWVPEYRSYSASGDTVHGRAWSASEAERLLEDLCASWAIRAARELLALDSSGHVLGVVINGIQRQFNPATGRDEDRQVLALDLTRTVVAQTDFSRIGPSHCVRANGDLALDRQVPRRGVLRTASYHEPAPTRPIRHNHDGEILAAEYMRWLGFADARELPIGPDGGIDVRASGAVAQVKMHATPVGRPDLQRLLGASQAEGAKVALFFSQQGYGAQAAGFAEQVGMPLFTFGYNDGVEPLNTAALQLVAQRNEHPEGTGSPYSWLEAEIARPQATAADPLDVPPDPRTLQTANSRRLNEELAWIEQARERIASHLSEINARWPEFAELPPPPDPDTSKARSLPSSVPKSNHPEQSPTIPTYPPPGVNPAQWAQDPYGRFELRYYDGARWTEHVSSGGVQGLDPL